MRSTTFILTLIIALSFTSNNLLGQSSDEYKVLFQRYDSTTNWFFDTIIPLEFLSQKNHNDMINMQDFERFDYPRFKQKAKGNVTYLYNKSIQIKLTTVPFDSLKFVSKYKLDSSLYYKSLYFKEVTFDYDFPPFIPEKEISGISLIINAKEIKVPEQYCKSLYRAY